MQTKILRCAVTYFLTAILGFFSMSIFADTYTWSLDNDDTDGTFATAKNWTLSDGTVATEAPGVDDDVVIPSGTAAYTVTASSKFNVKSLTIGDNENASATVTLKLNVQVNGGEFVGDVAEDIIVGAKGKITHTAVATTGTGTGTLGKKDYKLNLKAGRNITIKSYGAVNAIACGFASGSGPSIGASSGTYRGAAHGGLGNHRYWYDRNDTDKKPYLRVYGSIRNPVEPGSGGGCRGGGVIHLVAGGVLTINGTVSAGGNYTTEAKTWNAAGGSIILRGNSVIGSGTVSAQGSTATEKSTYPGGGGGRIAIYTDEKKEFSEIPFYNNVSVLGGNKKSSCGTIYFQSGNHLPNRGEIIIDNKGNYNSGVLSSKNMFLNDNITDIDEPFGKITVKGTINVCAYNVKLKLTSGVSVASGSMLFTRDTNAGIHFVPESGTVFNFSGSIATNHNFVCNAPGATLSFANNASMYINKGGNNVICGEPGNLLKLTSSTDTGSWTLYPRLEAKIDASYLDVSRGKASSSNKIAAKDSVGDDFSKENYWEFPASIKPGDPLTWTGASDTSWVNADNWVDQYGGTRLPEETDVITIPANCPNYPKLVAEQKVNTLSVEERALINLSGVNITVTNNLTVAGDITRSTTEKLIVAGEGDAVLDFGNREYGDVHITKSGGTIEFPNGLKTKRLKITSSAATTFVMPAGKTIEADVLDIDGNNGDFANKLITIVSSTPGTKWNLKVNDVMRIRGVNVSDSDASLGRTIAAGDFASDEGNNVNWDFSSGSAAEWVGGTDGNWTAPENWLPEGVPGEATVVAIRPKTAVTVTLSSTETIVPVGGIMLGGSDFSATLKCNKAVEVASGVDIDANGTLILNSIATNNIVIGNFVARPGSKITHDGPRWNNTQSCGVNLLVKGDMRVEKFGTTKAEINVEGKGFANGYGPGYAYGSGDSTPNPSHGGIGNIQNATSCYGSILNPYSFGSPYPTSGASGGGQVAITVTGDLIVDGAISANGGTSYGGTGGSILIKAASLRGAGTVSADGKSTGYGAAGGRVAIYLTEATSIASLTGGVTVYGVSSNSRYAGAGTKYYQFANNDEGGGTVYFNPGGNCGTSFPMADDGNPRTAYAKATVELSSGTLYLLKDTTVYDLNIKGGKINLQGHTLRVLSNKHKDGRGWTNSYANSVIANGGEIIWGAGFTIKIR